MFITKFWDKRNPPLPLTPSGVSFAGKPARPRHKVHRPRNPTALRLAEPQALDPELPDHCKARGLEQEVREARPLRLHRHGRRARDKDRGVIPSLVSSFLSPVRVGINQTLFAAPVRKDTRSSTPGLKRQGPLNFLNHPLVG